MTGQIGKPRDSAYEISNFLVFDSDVPQAVAAGSWGLESVIFSQPPNALGGCIEVNVVTRKTGKMMITLTWQKGALDINDEEEFVENTKKSMIECLNEVAAAPREVASTPLGASHLGS